MIAATFASDLSNIALLLAQTSANSVPSEQSFSTLNFLLNDLQNKLSNEKVNILQYIYINERVLAQASKQLDKVAPQNMRLAGDNSLVALEDELIQGGELGVESSKRGRDKWGRRKKTRRQNSSGIIP